MRVTFCGVRGSTPVAGPEFARVGGHTSCVAISRGRRAAGARARRGYRAPDASTREFGDAPFHGDDPAHAPALGPRAGAAVLPARRSRRRARSSLVQPAQGDPVATLARGDVAAALPDRPDGLRGAGSSSRARARHARVRASSEWSRATCATRVGARSATASTGDGASVAYVPDALDDNDDAIIELARDVDLFVRGAPFVAAEAERAERCSATAPSSTRSRSQAGPMSAGSSSPTTARCAPTTRWTASRPRPASTPRTRA